MLQHDITNYDENQLACLKKHKVDSLRSLSKEKQYCYKRIEQIIEEEKETNRDLGEIYESTRTDIHE